MAQSSESSIRFNLLSSADRLMSEVWSWIFIIGRIFRVVILDCLSARVTSDVSVFIIFIWIANAYNIIIWIYSLMLKFNYLIRNLFLFEMLLLGTLLYDSMAPCWIASFWLGTGIEGEIMFITDWKFFAFFLLWMNIFDLNYE